MHWKWKLLWVLGIAFLVFSVYIFAVLSFGPSVPLNHSRQTHVLTGATSFVLGAALIAVALIKRNLARSRSLTTAGILTLIAACICVFLGIAFAIAAIRSPPHLVSSFACVPAAFGLLGFGAGLGAGVLILKGRISRLAGAGMAFMLPEGFTVTIMGGWFFGAPIFLLVLISALLLLKT